MFLIPNSDSFGEMGLLDEPEPASSAIRECDAHGECASCKKKRMAKMKEKGPGAIHSAKFDRCVKKVGAKGKVDNKYAICMASLGKGKALKRGHGGNATEASTVEVNHCHGPGKGHPCDGGGLDPVSQKSADRAMGATLARRQIMTHDAPGFSAGKGVKATDYLPSYQKDKPVKPKVIYHGGGGPKGSGPHHIATYRDMPIHTLPGYTTPYYYVDAPGFGTMQHSPSFQRIKNQIDRYKDTGKTARGHERSKASARYQRRKAKGY